MQKKKEKLIVILGPTASGKSDLAVEIAKRYNGEVISADSRQVYKGMNIGTGKITKKEMHGIPHHMLDVANPKRIYSVAHFKHAAEKIIADIHHRGKLPILCGGSGFYIQAVVDGLVLPEVKPNKALRRELEKLPVEKLFSTLQKLDTRRAQKIDKDNPRRLIRAIEIATELGHVPHLVLRAPSLNTLQIGMKTSDLVLEVPSGAPNDYNILQIGITTPDKLLRERIHARLLKRMRHGMTAEVKRLHTEGVSWKRMEALGLEYRYLARFLQGKLTKEAMLEQLETAIWHYAKRQKTWFKRDTRIRWFLLAQRKRIEQAVCSFLK